MKSTIAAWLLAATFTCGALAQEHLDKAAIEKYGLKFLDETVTDVPAIGVDPGSPSPANRKTGSRLVGCDHGPGVN
jgi:hypothetical protein